MRARPSAAVAALLSAVAGGAFGQSRPLVTEPATTPAAGTIVFETGLQAIAGERSYVTGALRTRWEGPLLRLLYSPSDDVELGLDWVARVGVLGEEGRGAIASSDWGDVTLRAKWRIAGGRGDSPTLAVRFGAILPETSFDDKQFRPLGLGPNTLRVYLEGLLSRPIGKARLHLNAGLFIFDEVYRPHDQRDFFSYGLAVERPLSPAVSVLAEVAGREGKGMPGAEARRETRAGLRFGRGRRRIDVALRRGLREGDGSWGATAGLSWRLR